MEMADWIEHEAGLMEESQGSFAPEVLPDNAIVYSRQWWRRNADGTFTVVTYEASATKDDRDYDDEDEGRNIPPFQVEDILEVIRCRDKDDPGSTEITSDYEYGNTAWDYDSIESANAAAKRLVRDMTSDYINV